MQVNSITIGVFINLLVLAISTGFKLTYTEVAAFLALQISVLAYMNSVFNAIDLTSLINKKEENKDEQGN